MNSTRVRSLLLTLLCRVIGCLLAVSSLLLIGCGGATGLDGGQRQGVSGNAGVAAAGEAGKSELGGASGTGTAGGSAGNAGTGIAEAGAAGDTAQLISLQIAPVSVSVAMGTQAQLRATATYSDQSRKDVTASATWSSSATAIATVAAGTVSAVAPGSATVSAVYNGQRSSAAVTVPTAKAQSIAVTPTTASIGIQGTQAFQAVVTLSDGTTQDVTATATWASSKPAAATIANGGLATGVSAGTTTISAEAAGFTGDANLTVTQATLASIAVTPTNPSLGIGVNQTFTATGTFSDGTVSDVSSGATWASSDPAVASIDSGTHIATSISTGQTTISAAVGKLSGSTTMTVTSASLVSITVAPETSTLAVGGTVVLTATGTYSDNSTVDLTQSVTWSSNATTTALVSNGLGSQGTVTGVASGSATISATLGAVGGSSAVTVTGATLVSIDVTPANPTLPLGTTASLGATGTYSDNSVVDLTDSVTWTIDDPKVANVSNANANPGLVTAVAIGSTSAHAALGSVNAQTTITVTAAKLVSIAITPANPTLPAGTTQALVATGMYSDGSTLDVTVSAVWSTSPASIATVSNAIGTQGLATAIATGSSTVTATLNGVSGTTKLTVSAPTITQIVVSPIASSVRVGQTVRYTATAILSNNTQRDVTQAATWSSSDTKVAAFAQGPGGGMGGRVVNTLAVGTSTIAASYQNITGSTTLTVSNAVLSEIQVTPIQATLTVKGTRQYTATAIYSDNTQQDVTAQATWVSSNTGVAQVSTGGGGPGPGGGGGGGTRGTVTAIAAGSATISATVNGITGGATVTVTAATLSSISLTPVEPSVAVGTQVSFVATALYSDDTSVNVTNQATFTSSNPQVAAVSTANGSRGQTQTLTAGSATITAAYGGLTGSTGITVTSAKLTTIQITPFAPTLLPGFTTALTATGIYSDNTTRDLTTLVTWSSSDPSVAALSNAAATRGQLTPLKAGTATVTATYQSLSGTDAITVTSATLSAISVSPGSASIAQHASLAFVAVGTLSDSTTLDVTNYVTWLSTVPAQASISNANGSRGVATGLASGTVTISAVRGTLTGTATLTVQ
jgi:trimeric autotransporter adhesin